MLGRVVDRSPSARSPAPRSAPASCRPPARTTASFVLGNVPPGRVELRVRRIGYAPAREVLELLPGLERSVARRARAAAGSARQHHRHGGARRRSRSAGPSSSAGAATSRARSTAGKGVVVRRAGNGPGRAPGARQRARRGARAGRRLPGQRSAHRPRRPQPHLEPGGRGGDPPARRADGARRATAPSAACSWWRPGATSARRARPGPAATARSASGSAARPGRLTASASAERQAADFPYTVPEVRGGGEGVRRNAGGEQWAAALTLAGPVEVVLRGTLADRGLPGTTTNPTLQARAEDRSVLLGARTIGTAVLGRVAAVAGGARDRSGAAHRRRPTTPTPTASAATAELGYRLPVSRRRLARHRGGRRRGPGQPLRRATAIRADASFSQAALKLDARFAPARASSWSLAPAARLDVWTGSTTPRVSARIDAGWQRGRTALTLAVGSGVTPPVLADLFFREGVGVRLNPDLRPERVRWEVEAGLRRELGGGSTVGLRGFVGRVADMIIWAPDFRFIWSPRNFDVRAARRRADSSAGGARQPARQRQRHVQRRHLRHARRGPGPLSAPRHLRRLGRLVAGAVDRRPALAPDRPALSQQRGHQPAARPSRFSTSGSSAGSARASGSAARSGTSPTGEPNSSPPIRRPAGASPSLSPWWFHDAQDTRSPPRPLAAPPWRWAAPTRTRRFPTRRRCCSR